MNRRFLHLLLAVGIAVLFSACGKGNIYYTLETEVKVEDLSLPNDIVVFDVTKIGTTYYAAAGKIWHLEDTASEWGVNATVAPPHAGDLCTALVASPFGATLFGGFINSSGNLGLFESTAAPSFNGQVAVADADIAGAQIALLKTTVNPAGELAVVTARQPSAGADYQFGVVTSGDGTAFDVLDFDTTRPAGDEEKPINDVIWSTTVAPGAWFVTEGTKLYTDGGTGTLTLASMTGITAGEVLTGLLEYGTNLYVASKAGAVYYSSNGTSWTRIAAPTVSGDHPPLTHFAGPVGTTEILLVGSDGYGYYRLPTNPIGSLTRFPTSTSDLFSASVRGFFLDDPMDRVFAGTSMSGLWRGAVDVDGEIDWRQE